MEIFRDLKVVLYLEPNHMVLIFKLSFNFKDRDYE